MRKTIFAILMASAALPAFGWWNDDWEFRKTITVNTSATGVSLASPVNDALVLVRLHLGNFGYFTDTLPNGDDLRFVAADDITPLAFHVERFDSTNQIGLVWVRVPTVQPGSSTQSFYMYYGNASAPPAGNPAQTYDKFESLVLHFDEADSVPRDKTAYGHQPVFEGEIEPASLIGSGARLTGLGGIRVPAAPSLLVDPQKGWTFSTWLRLETPQSEGVLLDVADPVNGRLTVGVDGNTPFVDVPASATGAVRVPASAGLSLDAWHHLAVAVDASGTRLFIDGAVAGEGAAIPAVLSSDYWLGGAADASGRMTGVVLDEVRVSATVRGPDSIALAVGGEGTSSSLLAYGEDSQKEGGESESYFLITLRNVTIDGWVVIGILAVMAAISWYVMAVKGLIIARIRKDNKAFVEAYYESKDMEALYHEKTAEEIEEEVNPLLGAVSGDHSGYKSSTIYHLYRAGMKDVRGRFAGQSVGAARANVLTAEALTSIRAALDAANVRETQRLNNQMVLLTLAVSGGPFLGLLGTVVGVMITFAAIAASGDVNVNAIAPGIAAALVATVAGLVVAIPALFGYNYLGNRIKEITADNRVFLDEFLATLAETYSK